MKASCCSAFYVHSAVLDPTRIGYCSWTGELSTSHPVVGRLVFNFRSPKSCQKICISSSKIKRTLNTCATLPGKKTQNRNTAIVIPFSCLIHFGPCWALVHSNQVLRHRTSSHRMAWCQNSMGVMAENEKTQENRV